MPRRFIAADCPICRNCYASKSLLCGECCVIWQPEQPLVWCRNWKIQSEVSQKNGIWCSTMTLNSKLSRWWSSYRNSLQHRKHVPIISNSFSTHAKSNSIECACRISLMRRSNYSIWQMRSYSVRSSSIRKSIWIIYWSVLHRFCSTLWSNCSKWNHWMRMWSVRRRIYCQNFQKDWMEW